MNIVAKDTTWRSCRIQGTYVGSF